MNVEYIGIIFAFGAAVTWGVVYTVDQKILTELSPLTLLFVQYVVTALILAPFVFAQSSVVQSIHAMSTHTAVLMLTTILFTIAANMFILNSIKLLGASTASIVEITYPLFVVLLALVIYGTVPNAYVLFGGAIILVGSMIVTYFA